MTTTARRLHKFKTKFFSKKLTAWFYKDENRPLQVPYELIFREKPLRILFRFFTWPNWNWFEIFLKLGKLKSDFREEQK